MGNDAIKSLKSSLADLTYVLFVIGKEFSLIIQQTKDEQVNNKLHQVVSSLQDSNSEVIRLYHEIQSNEIGLQSEWYGDENYIHNLQHMVDLLRESIKTLIAGNQQFLNNIHES